jgi:hypothetical protein
MSHATALNALVRHGTRVPKGTLWSLVLIYCATPSP